MLAALDERERVPVWYALKDKVYRKENLQAAWERVRANRGAAGVDRQSVAAFAAHAERYLEELHQELRTETYHAQAVRRCHIPKEGTKEYRPLGIPTVKDRVVQTALKHVLEPIWEARFHPRSFGFRPGRGCKDALRQVDRLLHEGCVWVVDADIQAYFDSIDKDQLMKDVKEVIADGAVLRLIAQYLHQGVLEEGTQWTPKTGTPQGAVISPLLANLYLHPLDERMTKLGYRMVRYADDFVILCGSAEQAHLALEEVKAWVEANGLTLHPDKTHVGDCRAEGQGFEFLGYRFEAGKRWVRKKSLQGFKDKIREKTRRTRGDSLTQIIADITPMIRGWYGYFKHACRREFPKLDGFIRRRLRAILRKQEKRPGFGKCHADHRRWPNVYFAALGLFTMAEARMSASQSR
jgi:RNA-directed DNA polymerase